MELLADVVWPDKEREHSFPERKIQVADRKNPADRPQYPTCILRNDYVFHIEIISCY